MKTFLKCFVIFSVLLLSACSTTASTERTVNQTYQGKSIDALVSIIGMPQSQYGIANGDIQYGWLIKEVIQTPMTSIHNGPPLREGSDDEIDPLSSGRSVRTCRLSALVDNNNIIRSVNFEQDTLGTKAFHFSMCAQVLETE
ncbi:hypothetical protein [Shewanella surugensis]|uniref:Lipoprotein SmpA/OmlA domain-containing protein n=1 Tax=Shewanella surugensis TaxID=212020 RepID=A0ABT0LJS7_9GAMM|nr:hypothetical protein [Shewanella surugensis]MCL1127978.1 hypothetical protein [Shewanella surugensis]